MGYHEWWAVDGWQREVGGGQWAVGDGKRGVSGGRWEGEGEKRAPRCVRRGGGCEAASGGVSRLEGIQRPDGTRTWQAARTDRGSDSAARRAPEGIPCPGAWGQLPPCRCRWRWTRQCNERKDQRGKERSHSLPMALPRQHTCLRAAGLSETRLARLCRLPQQRQRMRAVVGKAAPQTAARLARRIVSTQ